MVKVTATATGIESATAADRKTLSKVPFKYRHDVAQYVAVMIMELRQIAEQAELGKIAGAPEEAYYEAYSMLSNDYQNECQYEHSDNPARHVIARK